MQESLEGTLRRKTREVAGVGCAMSLDEGVAVFKMTLGSLRIVHGHGGGTLSRKTLPPAWPAA
jgi:hypothetical protein